ncbi:MAG: hypothetical protein MZV70_46125 [Desulfobacterales bacterium]|nr:hypothetical protein [Desulfobacterales bacterium]
MGVDLGREDLKLVKVKRVSDRKVELLEFTRVALDPGDPERPPELPAVPRVGAAEILRPFQSDRALGAPSRRPGWKPATSRSRRSLKTRSPTPSSGPIRSTRRSTKRKPSSTSTFSGKPRRAAPRKSAVMAYTAPRQEVEDLQRSVRPRRLPADGHFHRPLRRSRPCCAPAASSSHGAAVSSLYIGRDWSRIDIFSERQSGAVARHQGRHPHHGRGAAARNRAELVRAVAGQIPDLRPEPDPRHQDAAEAGAGSRPERLLRPRSTARRAGPLPTSSSPSRRSGSSR